MQYDEYLLNEAYKHEDGEMEDRYKVYLLFSLSGEFLWSDTVLERITIEPDTYIGWIWNTDFDQYNPEKMLKLMEKLEE